MSVLIKGITLEQFYRDLNNVRDMDVDWDIVQLSDDVRPVVRGRDICNTVNGHCEFKCSVCGVELSSVYGGDNDFGLDGGYFNFCPNCGADMRGEENAQS